MGFLFHFLLSSTPIKSCFTNCIVSVMIWKYRMKCKSISNFYAYYLLISCIMLPKLAWYFLFFSFFFPCYVLFCLVTLLLVLLSLEPKKYEEGMLEKLYTDKHNYKIPKFQNFPFCLTYSTYPEIRIDTILNLNILQWSGVAEFLSETTVQVSSFTERFPPLLTSELARLIWAATNLVQKLSIFIESTQYISLNWDNLVSYL